MRIIGFNFTKITAERDKPINEKLQISSNIEIIKVEQEKEEIVRGKIVLRLDFEFSIVYKPSISKIKLEGNVIILTEKDESKNMLKKWKSKKIPEEIRLPILNLILTKSNLRALQLEEELNLPPHIPLPKIKSKEEKDNNRSYTG